MVKSLSNVCLDFICKDYAKFAALYAYLTPEQKESVIERLANHERFDSIAPTVIFDQFSSKNLKDVTLQHCSQIDDYFLEVFSKCKCKLNSLNISFCKYKNISDEGLGLLLSHQLELKRLTLIGIPKVTGKCFSSFICPTLWFVNLKSCDDIESAGVSHLVQNCKGISSLDLSYCTKLNDAALDCIAGYLLGNLELLNCSYLLQITDQALISLADRCCNLKQLKLHGCTKISSAGVRAVFKACQLSVVDLSYCYGILTEPDILSDCLPPTLSKITLRGTQVGGEFIDALRERCTELLVLKLCCVHVVTDEVVVQLTQQIGLSLRELDLSWCSKLTDASLTSIVKHCKNLYKISLTYCDGITGAPLKQYANSGMRKQAEALTHLAVGACRQLKTDVLLDIFPKCVNLQHVGVSGQKSFCDEHLLSLAKNCPNLREISIKGCVQVTDAGVCELVRCCTNLHSMVLSGINNLTDKSIFFMATSIASTLKRLYVSGCSKISHHTVTYLKDVCINFLIVEHKVPNAAPDQLMARNLDTGEFCRGDLMDVFAQNNR